MAAAATASKTGAMPVRTCVMGREDVRDLREDRRDRREDRRDRRH
jgi:hypothetical protein